MDHERDERGRRAQRWWATYAEVVSGVARDGHLPRHHSRREQGRTREDQLADWLSRQRSSWTRLTNEQRDALEELPGFSADPLGDRWDMSYDDVVEFIADNGRVPRRRAPMPEGRLGDWLRQQDRLIARNELPYGRFKRIRNLGRGR